MTTFERASLGDLSPERWARVRTVASEALDVAPAQRAAYILAACGDDLPLRGEVEQLVAACDVAARSPFLAESPTGMLEREGNPIPRVLRDALADRYAIDRELGRGGMATVYLAHDRRHDRRVAVKVLHPTLGAWMSGQRFLREVRFTAGLTHPHILPLHDSGEAAGFLYYVMPFVDGETLRHRLAREGALPISIVVQLMREVASALDYAHRSGIVHRDIKPENILLADGHAIVADFGIARALDQAQTASTKKEDSGTLRTEPGVILGTPAYLAPEQALGESGADQHSDLYALGIVAYECLTGAHPFAGSRQRILAVQLGEQIPAIHERRADVPRALGRLVGQLVAHDPAQRPPSAAHVLRALEASDAAPAPRRTWRRIAMIAGVAALGVIAGSYELWRHRPAAIARPSVVVLPFANTGNDPENQHFSDGLTDELIGALARVPGLRVAGRTSAYALKARALSLRAIAESLGVGAVVDGSVQRSGDRLRVTAQLVSAANDSTMWSRSYDRQVADVFVVQEEIARAIVNELRVTLGANGAISTMHRTIDPVAHELYLKGRFVENTQLGREGLRKAADYFERSIARDSTYAPAYSGLSDAHARLGVFGYGSAHEEFAQAKAAAHRALALDSTLAAAHASLAHSLFVYDFRRDAAEREFKIALALQPNLTFARSAFAICLQDQARFREALAQLDSAHRDDPLDATVPTVLGRVYVSAKRPDDALRELREALKLNPYLDLAYQQLAYAYLQKGMSTEAIDAMRHAAAMSGARDSAELAYVYAVTGAPNEARHVIGSLTATGASSDALSFHYAMAYAALGDVNEAFRWLERGFEARASFMDGVMITEAFEPLHGDPRWARLLRRMGFKV